MIKICKRCLKKFFDKKNTRVFCSVHCSAKFSKAQNLLKWRGRKTGKFISCYICKKITYKYPRDIKRNSKRMFCGQNCFIKWTQTEYSIEQKLKGTQPPVLSGINSPAWKGGISRAYKTGYYSIKYRNWRKQVFERDNFECQKCFQKRGKYITAHHIKSWRNYLDLRYELSNGVTLCELCHNETDNYKGRAKRDRVV